VREANRAQSRKDFAAKMNIALKEAAETEYWLILLKEAGYISEKEYVSIANDCSELNRILIAIVKSAKT
jgi:four helix bundle protein